MSLKAAAHILSIRICFCGPSKVTLLSSWAKSFTRGGALHVGVASYLLLSLTEQATDEAKRKSSRVPHPMKVGVIVWDSSTKLWFLPVEVHLCN
mmetsp:Transcript_7470/g.12674  ORF Transcript_7470/g.12674 Transcript_7470/m.12674 type:complete len:94 (+) Transcript_7470:594-875(+)